MNGFSNSDLEEKIKNLQNQLENYTSAYKTLFEHIPVGILIFDLKGNILNANDEVLQYLGSPSVQATKQINIYTIEYLKKTRFIQDYELCIKKLKEFSGENDYLSKWGKTRRMRYLLNPVFDYQNMLYRIQASFVDITAERENEKKLEFTQEKYQMLSDMAFEGIVIHEKGMAIDVNKAFCNLTGYNAEELIGIDVIELIADLDSKQLIKKNIRKKYAHPYEIIAVKKDGTKFFAEIEGRDFDLANGQIIHAASLRDISSRKKIYSKLQKLNTAVEQSANAIVITDSHAVVEYVNPAFTQLTGFTKEEVIGQNMSILKSGFQSDDFYEDLWKTIRSGEKWKSQFYNKKKNGTYYWEQNTITPILDEQGNITNFISVKENITDIVENQLRLETLINAIPDPILFKDEKNQWIEINEATKEMFNISEGDYFGKTSSEIARLVPDLSDELTEDEKLDNEAWQKKDILIKNLSLQNKGKKKIYETTRIPLFHQDKSRKALVVITRDISEIENHIKELKLQNEQYQSLSEQYRTQNEQLKIAKEKADESNRLKSSFINNVSHEFRTPMNSIIGFSNLLTRENLSKEKRIQYSNTIEKNCNLLLDIVSDTIEISKIQTNQLKEFQSKTNIRKLVEEIVLEFKPEFEKKNLDIKIHFKCSELTNVVLIDGYKLKQIIKHLISNALKFTHKGGVSVYCENIKNEEFEIKIIDSGIGISKKMQEIIFAPYSQVDYGTSRSFGGIGVGLTLVKAYVDLLKGTISLESEENKGSIFTVKLPYKSIQKKNETSRLDENLIIIAEDDNKNFLLLKEFLSDKNTVIKRAKNGEEAIDLCRNFPQAKILLMDIQMPKLNGIEAAKIIVNFRPQLKIIALSAHVSPQDYDILHSAGFSKIMQKPVNLSELTDLLIKNEII